MAKIIHKKPLPKRINVVVDKKVIAKVDFGVDGIYETDNEDEIRELKEYGYEVEETKKPKKKLEDID